MMNENIIFAFAILVGISMVLKPNFVLFRPSRKGQFIAKLIGENNWPYLIQIFGTLLAIISAFVLYNSL